MEWALISPVPSLLMKHLVIGQRQKAPNFSAFHWSPHGYLVSIGQHFVTMRVVHLPKRTETSLITVSDHSGSNHQLFQLCTARIAWSNLDQAVRAVHSCNSSLRILIKLFSKDKMMKGRIFSRLRCSCFIFIYLHYQEFSHLKSNSLILERPRHQWKQ